MASGDSNANESAPREGPGPLRGAEAGEAVGREGAVAADLLADEADGGARGLEGFGEGFEGLDGGLVVEGPSFGIGGQVGGVSGTD